MLACLLGRAGPGLQQPCTEPAAARQAEGLASQNPHCHCCASPAVGAARLSPFSQCQMGHVLIRDHFQEIRGGGRGRRIILPLLSGTGTQPPAEEKVHLLFKQVAPQPSDESGTEGDKQRVPQGASSLTSSLWPQSPQGRPIHAPMLPLNLSRNSCSSATSSMKPSLQHPPPPSSSCIALTSFR